jgi:hypothetical protein
MLLLRSVFEEELIAILGDVHIAELAFDDPDQRFIWINIRHNTSFEVLQRYPYP